MGWSGEVVPESPAGISVTLEVETQRQKTEPDGPDMYRWVRAESGCFRSCDVRTSEHGGSPSVGRLRQFASMTTTGNETTGDGGLAAHRGLGDGVMNDLVSPIAAGRGGSW